MPTPPPSRSVLTEKASFVSWLDRHTNICTGSTHSLKSRALDSVQARRHWYSSFSKARSLFLTLSRFIIIYADSSTENMTVIMGYLIFYDNSATRWLAFLESITHRTTLSVLQRDQVCHCGDLFFHLFSIFIEILWTCFFFRKIKNTFKIWFKSNFWL